MITMYKNNNVNNVESGNREVEYRGLSTDTKPTKAENGSVFSEIDTGKLFIYDKENEQWKEV